MKFVDPKVPQERNLISHKIVADGIAPRRTFTAVFDYEDGCVRSFNSSDSWKVLKQSERAIKENAQ